MKIQVLNEGTGSSEPPSRRSGNYVATNLPVGVYTVKLEATGFQTVTRTRLNLVADGRLTVDFTLQPAGAVQSVDVIAATGEAVNTVSGEISRVVNTQQVQDLALNTRSFMQLATLIPGSALLGDDQLAVTQFEHHHAIGERQPK